MYHMVKATVRDLRYRFPKVESLLQEGQEVQITKRKRVIARLVPELSVGTPRLPDFMARLKKIYGNRRLSASGADLIRSERDERY